MYFCVFLMKWEERSYADLGEQFKIEILIARVGADAAENRPSKRYQKGYALKCLDGGSSQPKSKGIGSMPRRPNCNRDRTALHD